MEFFRFKKAKHISREVFGMQKRPALRGLDLGICRTSKLKPTFFKRDNEKNDHVRVKCSCMVVFCITSL
jgi:hypothetical protein